ncbi:hypothetical protein R6Q59_035387 [Mikania micrantha]
MMAWFLKILWMLNNFLFQSWILKEYFDLQTLRNTDQWEGIRLGIHAECQRAYKDRNQEFKKYFDKVGGYEDIVKAKSKPPEHMEQEAWEQLIDELFSDPDFRKRSESGIEVFKETHFKVEKGWANEIAESDYEMMQEEFKKSTQESGDSSSVNQIECMERVFGQRRGHIRGVGRVVRHPPPDVSQTYPSREGE